jgi:peptidyl-prolyl cis-trans isomerase A (cyclophilin A)
MKNKIKSLSKVLLIACVLVSFKPDFIYAQDKLQSGLYAELTTTKGKIVCQLEYQKIPVTVANFVGLAEGTIPNSVKAAGQPFYDGLTFHRCIRNFMIQGGDPTGTGSGGAGHKFNDEFDLSLDFTKPGVLAMANAGPNTNDCQFFITEVPTLSLNYHYSVFGHTVEGQQLVSQINNGEKIISIKIIRVGKEAKDFDAAAVWAKRDELLKKKADEFAKQKSGK